MTPYRCPVCDRPEGQRHTDECRKEMRLKPWPEFQTLFAHQADWVAGRTPDRTRTYSQQLFCPLSLVRAA